MRDALSLLDQVLSLTGGEVGLEAVRRVLGLVEEERYLELLDVLADGRHGDVFVLVEGLLDEGYDLIEFYHGLMDVLRALLRLRLSPDARLDLRDDLRVAFAERADRFAPGDLVRMLSAAAELESSGSIRRSPNPRVLVEMLLLRLSYLDRTVELEELIRALGGAPPPAGGAGGGGGASGRSAAESPVGEGGGQPSLGLAPKAGATEPAIGPPAAPGAGVASIPEDDIVPSGTLGEAWTRWLDGGRGVPRGLSAFLRSATVREEDGVLVVAVPPGPAVERLGDAGVRREISAGLAPYLGRSLGVRVAVANGGQPGSGTPRRISREEVRADTLKALYRKEPRLQRAVEELDLELME